MSSVSQECFSHLVIILPLFWKIDLIFPFANKRGEAPPVMAFMHVGPELHAPVLGKFAKLSPAFVWLPLASVLSCLLGIGGPELVCIKTEMRHSSRSLCVCVGRKITIQYFRHLSEANKLLAQSLSSCFLIENK